MDGLEEGGAFAHWVILVSSWGSLGLRWRLPMVMVVGVMVSLVVVHSWFLGQWWMRVNALVV